MMRSNFEVVTESPAYWKREFYHIVGRNIAKHREALGWSQKRLAEECPTSVQIVSQAENGHGCPFHVASMLADALDCNLYDLVGDPADTAPTGGQ